MITAIMLLIIVGTVMLVVLIFVAHMLDEKAKESQHRREMEARFIRDPKNQSRS